MIKGIFPEGEQKRVSRQTLQRIVERQGLVPLWSKLSQIDPEYARKIGKNDKIRIIRAMEIYYNHQLPPSKLFASTQTPFKDYEFIRVGLNIPRDRLYNRIEQRVDDMINRGWVGEVKRLREKYPPGCPPFKSVGYKEILMYLDKEMDWQDAVGLIKQRSRNYAKRQLSWFRQEKDIRWFEPDQLEEIEKFVLKKSFAFNAKHVKIVT
jgi:tRNA dimethylallyltransferase